MNIKEYLAWRDLYLKQPEGQIFMSNRGSCVIGPSFTIEDVVRDDWHMRARDIEDAEFNLIYFGADQPEVIKARLYDKDEALYNSYKQLKIERLKLGDRKSRKNIICVPECCLCYWQVFNDTLIVISRSWDIQRAGLSDLVIANRVAKMLDCKYLRFVTLNNHVYLDREHIARPLSIPHK